MVKKAAPTLMVLRLEELEEEAKYLRICDYGEPGAGKTWFGASAALDPHTAPCLFVDFRSQITSLRVNPKYKAAIEDGQLVIVRITKYTDLDHIYTFLHRGKGFRPDFDALFERHGPPKTVVLDSTTELQRAEVMRIAGNTPGQFVSELEIPEIQDWGKILNQFCLLAHLWYNLPYHMIFSGLEDIDFGRRVVGQAPKVTGYRLALQGAGQRQFPAYALTLMRLARAPASSTAFNLGYTQAARIKSKDQTGCFPAIIGDPTIPLMAKWLRDGGYPKPKAKA